MAGRLAVKTKVKTTCERKAGRNVTDLDFQLTNIGSDARTDVPALATFRVSQSAHRTARCDTVKRFQPNRPAQSRERCSFDVRSLTPAPALTGVW